MTAQTRLRVVKPLAKCADTNGRDDTSLSLAAKPTC